MTSDPTYVILKQLKALQDKLRCVAKKVDETTNKDPFDACPCPAPLCCGVCSGGGDKPSKRTLELVPHNIDRNRKCFPETHCSDFWKGFYIIACDQTAFSCSKSWLRITEVHHTGKFIKLFNTSVNKPAEIGNHYLVQLHVGESPMFVYKFPPRLHFSPKATVKVWAKTKDPQKSDPPKDLIFTELSSWNTDDDIVTILCCPNRKVVTCLAGCQAFASEECIPCRINWTTTGLCDPKEKEKDEDDDFESTLAGLKGGLKQQKSKSSLASSGGKKNKINSNNHRSESAFRINVPK